MIYADKPIASSAEDKLGRKNFANQLANTLVNLNSNDTFTVGLFGKWGCGKTSLVNMILEEIEHIQAASTTDQKLIIVHFEPWNFTDTSQLLTQFFVGLANELQTDADKALNRIGKALVTYSNALSFLEFIPKYGTLISKILKCFSSLLGNSLQKGLDEHDVLKQKNRIIQLLEKQPHRILIVIDDIDRLNNEQIRYIFQLITSVAKFPKLTYLVVFDKEIVVEALKNVQTGNGQDYLEKIIQMPIQIPDIQRSDLRKELTGDLEQIKAEFNDVSFNERHWKQCYDTCVEPFITHLRDVYRLCNALRFKLSSISSEVEFTDMLAISVLEIHHPLVYEWVKSNKSILTGDHDFSSLMANNSQKDWSAYYKEQLQGIVIQERPNASSEPETDIVIRFLSKLFPYFEKKIGKQSEVYENDVLRHFNQIGHPEKFDRYFQLDIDRIAYRTADVQNVLYGLNETDIITFLLHLNEKDTSYEFLRDVQNRIDELSGDRAKVLVRALIEAVKTLKTSTPRGVFAINAGTLAEDMLPEIIKQIPPEERTAFISDLISESNVETTAPIALIINTIELGYGHLLAHGQETDSQKLITANELNTVENMYKEHMQDMLKSNSLFDFFEWHIVYHLLNAFAPNYTKNYLNNALTEDINILRFFDYFSNPDFESSILYGFKDDELEYFSIKRALVAIENCRANGTFFTLPQKTQNRCAMFYITQSHDPKYKNKSVPLAIEEFLSPDQP